MRITPRVSGIRESATVRLSRRAKQLRAEGHDLLDLTAGEPDFGSPGVALEAAERALREGFTKYTDSSGLPELREALAASYANRFAAPWGAGEVIVTVGAKMALFELSQVLFRPGDEVVVPSPCWVSFPEQIRLAGATPVFVETSPEDAFRIHGEAILDALTERSRAVLINAPCNPTGGCIEADCLRRVACACAERGVALICDETYERFVYGERSPISAASLAAEFPETVVVVGSFSKTWAMTGWRVGFALGPGDWIRAMAKVQSHTTSNATSFAMAGAVAALRHGEEHVRSCLEEYAARRDLVVSALNALPGVCCSSPSGAFYVFPEVDGEGIGAADSTEISEILLSRAGVATVPGAAFRREGHLRLSFACSRETLQRATERMGEALTRGAAVGLAGRTKAQAAKP